MPPTLATLYRFMSPSRRRQALRLAVLMPAAALAEMITVTAIVPLLAVLAGESQRRKIPWLADGLAALADRVGASLLGVASGLFIAAALIAALVRLLLARSSQRFAYGLGHELAVEIQRRVLLQPYLFHVGHHSSRIISSLEKVEQFVFSLLLPLIQGVGAAVIGIFIAAALFAVDAKSTMLALVSVAGAYALVLFAARRRLDQYSEIIGTAYDQRVQAVQESLGGIRDIIIDQSQPLYLDAFRSIDERLNRARTDIAILGIAPRLAREQVYGPAGQKGYPAFAAASAAQSPDPPNLECAGNGASVGWRNLFRE